MSNLPQHYHCPNLQHLPGGFHILHGSLDRAVSWQEAETRANAIYNCQEHILATLCISPRSTAPAGDGDVLTFIPDQGPNTLEGFIGEAGDDKAAVDILWTELRRIDPYAYITAGFGDQPEDDNEAFTRVCEHLSASGEKYGMVLEASYQDVTRYHWIKGEE